MIQTIVPISGKIREILTSDDETIKKHHLTSVYLDYIKMIEKREETSKDAPTEEVKNNVSKIYSEVTSGGLFSSLTQGIRGMFGSRRSATSSNFDQIWSLQRQRVGQASTSTDTAPSTNAVTIRSFASFKNLHGHGWENISTQPPEPHALLTTLDLRQTSMPDTYKEAKTLLTKIRRCCDQRSVRSFRFELEVNRLLQKIVLLFKLDIQKDPDAKEDLRWLKNWAVKSNDAKMRFGLYNL